MMRTDEYATDITLVLPYYDNPGMLSIQYEVLSRLPEENRKHIELVVVDDGSPRWPAEIAKPGVALQIYRIDKDVRWNQDAARNIGVKHATHERLILTDVDHVVPPDGWEYLIWGTWHDTSIYRFGRVSAPNMAPYKPHPNSFFITKRKYEEIGGYDERLAGYYGSDGDFLRRVRDANRGEEPGQLAVNLVRYGRETQPDASTTTYGRKEWFDKPTIKSIVECRNRDPDWRPLRYRFPYHKVT